MRKKIPKKVADIELHTIIEPKAMIRMEIDKDYIAELAQSISEVGLLQPVLVAIDGEKYEMVAGHCRYLAHKRLGLSKIKAIVCVMTAEEVAVARATENLTRADLTPVEEAATYKNLIDVLGFTIEKVALKMGKTPGTIKRRMDLLKMPAMLQKAVHKKQISMTVAEELWSIRNETSLEYYLMFAIENGCTQVVARQWAKEWMDTQRRQHASSVQGGGGDLSPFEPRPTYLPCDICNEPVELGKDRLLRICQNCGSAIKKGMEVK